MVLGVDFDPEIVDAVRHAGADGPRRQSGGLASGPRARLRGRAPRSRGTVADREHADGDGPDYRTVERFGL